MRSTCKKKTAADKGKEDEEGAEADMQRTGVQRIFLSYISMLTSVGAMRVQGPELLRDILGYAYSAAGGVSLSHYSSRCLLGLPFWGVVWGTQLLPLFFICLLWLLGAIIPRYGGEFFKGGCVLIVYLKLPDCINMLLKGTSLPIRGSASECWFVRTLVLPEPLFAAHLSRFCHFCQSNCPLPLPASIHLLLLAFAPVCVCQCLSAMGRCMDGCMLQVQWRWSALGLGTWPMPL